jgi:V8-like Glu-specific endopeptidase
MVRTRPSHQANGAPRAALTVCVAVAISALYPAGAGAAPPSIAVHRVRQPASSVLKHWTPTRKAAANAPQIQAPAVPTGGQSGPPQAGKPTPSARGGVSVPGHGPGLEHRLPKATGLPGGVHANKFGRELPWRIQGFGYTSAIGPVGRLFFDTPDGPSACSATLVSPNIVLTAAHCVRDGLDGTWFDNWVFVPGVGGYDQPYGAFAARWVTVKARWSQYPYNVSRGTTGGYSPMDYAFLVLDTDYAGNNAGDYVGSFGFLMNPPKRTVYQQGYPSEGMWSECAGEYCRPWYCQAKVQAYDRYRGGRYDQGMSCLDSGGSSGAPWFVKWHGAWYVASVQSHMGVVHLDDNDERYGISMYGPYLDGATGSLFDYAQTL